MLLRRSTALDIAFNSKLLRSLCENSAKARRILGVDVADKLKRRVADLRAAESLNELVAGNPTQLSTPDQAIAVTLCNGHRLIFCPVKKTGSQNESGEADWAAVHRVKILEIGGNHA